MKKPWDLIDPKFDYVFKRIIGDVNHPLARLDLVNAIFEAHQQPLVDEQDRLLGARLEGEAKGNIEGKSEEKIETARKLFRAKQNTSYLQ